MSAHARQRGLALITAMLVIAIVATLATYVGLSQQVWLRQTQNISDLAQAEAIGRGAIRYGALLLQREAKNSNIDTLNETWNKPITLPVEGGFVTIRVVDAQSRFNLNNVVATGQPSPGGIGVFRNLLTSLDLDPNLTDALVDWIDDGSDVRPGGAEDLDYLNHDPPYRTANQPLESVDELRRVKGFTDEVVEKLRPFVTALPGRTSVNLNTAPPELLAAVTGLPASALAPIVSARVNTPLTDANQFMQLLQLPKAPPDTAVNTAFFLVTIDASIGRSRRHIDALVKREAGNQPSVLWQQQAPIQIRAEKKT